MGALMQVPNPQNNIGALMQAGAMVEKTLLWTVVMMPISRAVWAVLGIFYSPGQGGPHGPPAPPAGQGGPHGPALTCGGLLLRFLGFILTLTVNILAVIAILYCLPSITRSIDTYAHSVHTFVFDVAKLLYQLTPEERTRILELKSKGVHIEKCECDRERPFSWVGY
jgi:hypothetical protein